MFGLPEPYLTETNGTKAWKLTAKEISNLQEQLQHRDDVHILAPRMQTSDSIPSALFSGNTVKVNGTNVDVGLTVNFYPRFKRGAVDLLGDVLSLELLTNNTTIRTNLALATRLQLTNGAGAFIVPATTAGNIYGVIFDVTWPQLKKKLASKHPSAMR